MLDGIAREVEKEQEVTQLNSEEMLTQAFIAAATEIPRNSRVSKKKKSSLNVPRSFAEACQYKWWSDAINCEYNALVKRGTWSYVKRTPDMKPVPYTWVFKQKPLDTEGKKFIEKSSCYQLGD